MKRIIATCLFVPFLIAQEPSSLDEALFQESTDIEDLCPEETCLPITSCFDVVVDDQDENTCTEMESENTMFEETTCEESPANTCTESDLEEITPEETYDTVTQDSCEESTSTTETTCVEEPEPIPMCTEYPYPESTESTLEEITPKATDNDVMGDSFSDCILDSQTDNWSELNLQYVPCEDNKTICLSNGSSWQILSDSTCLKDGWSADDTIIVQLQRSFFFRDAFYIYNVSKNAKVPVHYMYQEGEQTFFLHQIEPGCITIRHNNICYAIEVPEYLYNLDAWNVNDPLFVGSIVYADLAYYWSGKQTNKKEIFLYNQNNHQKIYLQIQCIKK